MANPTVLIVIADDGTRHNLSNMTDNEIDDLAASLKGISKDQREQITEYPEDRLDELMEHYGEVVSGKARGFYEVLHEHLKAASSKDKRPFFPHSRIQLLWNLILSCLKEGSYFACSRKLDDDDIVPGKDQKSSLLLWFQVLDCVILDANPALVKQFGRQYKFVPRPWIHPWALQMFKQYTGRNPDFSQYDEYRPEEVVIDLSKREDQEGTRMSDKRFNVPELSEAELRKLALTIPEEKRRLYRDLAVSVCKARGWVVNKSSLPFSQAEYDEMMKGNDPILVKAPSSGQIKAAPNNYRAVLEALHHKPALFDEWYGDAEQPDDETKKTEEDDHSEDVTQVAPGAVPAADAQSADAPEPPVAVLPVENGNEDGEADPSSTPSASEVVVELGEFSEVQLNKVIGQLEWGQQKSDLTVRDLVRLAIEGRLNPHQKLECQVMVELKMNGKTRLEGASIQFE